MTGYLPVTLLFLGEEEMATICPLFSGSTGNSTYISTEDGAILVDAGASFKGISSAIEKVGGSTEDIKAVAITHEHIDHIKGLKPLINKTKATVIASSKTLETLIELDKIPKWAKTIAVDNAPLEIGGIILNRFATSHDCDGSSGYTFTLKDSKKIAVCTDLGIVTDEVRSAIEKSDVLVFESNHDIEMLKKGPYPPSLKIRIMSDKGHISNNACAAELAQLLKSGTTRFILAHLSQNNNLPLLARSCAEAALMDIGAQNKKDYILTVASPCGNGVTII